MTAKAFVLIQTEVEVAKTAHVVAAIKQLGGKRVKWVGTVTGPYDVIAVIEGETLQEIGELITGKINSIAGISRVVTCFAI